MARDYTFGSYVSLWVFGLAFGLVEAAVVVYLRQLFGIDGDSLFPLRAGLHDWGLTVMRVEAWREIATLVLMAVPAVLFSRAAFPRFLAYVMVWGLWDIAYYVYLHAFLGWPAGPMTYDVLFLLPTVWVAPVICPIMVAAAMIVFPSLYLQLARTRIPRLPGPVHWLVALLGGGIILYAFLRDAPYYIAGGLPPRFAWTVFLIGYVLAAGSGAHFLIQFARQSKAKFA